jgi:hypothetical protein
MATDDRQAEVSVPPDPPAAESRTVRTVLIGSSMIFWVLAFFVINVLNDMSRELKDLNRRVDILINIVSGQSGERFHVTDEDGKILYSIERKPIQDLDPDDPMLVPPDELAIPPPSGD